MQKVLPAMLAYCYKGDTERARQLLEANWTSVDELDEVNGNAATPLLLLFAYVVTYFVRMAAPR